MKILVIEDNKTEQKRIEVGLRSEMHIVECTKSSDKGIYLAKTNDYNLLIISHLPPLINALEMCETIKATKSNCLVLIIANRCCTNERADLYEAGADGCIVNPFSIRELILKIKSLSKRYASTKNIYTAGNIVLDSSAQKVLVNNSEIYLTTKEFLLLEILMRNKGKVVTRGIIMEYVWSSESNPFSRTIETHILNIRKKMGQKEKYIIQNIPGRGYKILD